MIQNMSWANAEQTAINCEINHPDYGWIPFTASPNDPEEHGRNIHAACLSGEHGPVAAYESPPLLPEPSQLEKDQLRYQRRAAAKDGLIAWMAADNMTRVRAGVWTVADLQSLLVDLAPINAMMQTLSFELAAQAITASSNTLLTPGIKTAWTAKLTEHFYIVA